MPRHHRCHLCRAIAADMDPSNMTQVGGCFWLKHPHCSLKQTHEIHTLSSQLELQKLAFVMSDADSALFSAAEEGGDVEVARLLAAGMFMSNGSWLHLGQCWTLVVEPPCR